MGFRIMEKIYVYGTLKKGHPLHHVIEDCKFLGRYHTEYGYVLLRGYYPFLVPREGGDGAWGELYEVPAYLVPRLDQIEGHPTFYRRQEILLDDPKSHGWLTAWAYIHPDNLREDYPIIEEF